MRRDTANRGLAVRQRTGRSMPVNGSRPTASGSCSKPVYPSPLVARPRGRSALQRPSRPGLLTFRFILVFVVNDAAGRVGVQQVLERPGPPGSPLRR